MGRRASKSSLGDRLPTITGKGTKGYDVILGFDPHSLTDGTFPGYRNDISLSGLKLLQVDPDVAIAALQSANGGSYAIYFGTLLGFDRLGIVLSDWRDLDSSERWIAAGSRKGYEVMVGTDDPDQIVR